MSENSHRICRKAMSVQQLIDALNDLPPHRRSYPIGCRIDGALYDIEDIGAGDNFENAPEIFLYDTPSET